MTENKENVEKNENVIESAFKQVWAIESKTLESARSLELAGNKEDAKKAYETAIEEYEKDMNSKHSFPYRMKAEAYKDELFAKVSLATAKKFELEGKPEDSKKHLNIALDFYERLTADLKALQSSCDAWEDIAQIQFEAEAKNAEKIVKSLQNYLGIEGHDIWDDIYGCLNCGHPLGHKRNLPKEATNAFFMCSGCTDKISERYGIKLG